MYFDFNAVGRNAASARTATNAPTASLRSPNAVAQAALAAFASLNADPNSLMRLLRQLPQAPLPRPPQHNATLQQASAQLGEFLNGIPGSQLSTDVGYRQYLDLQAMRRLIDRKITAQAQLEQSLSNQPVASTRSSLNPTIRIQPLRAPSTGQTTPTAPATSQSTTPATTTDPAVPTTPTTAPSTPTPSTTADPTTPSTTTTTPSAGPRVATDEFGSGLGAGMGHSSNLSNSPEVVLALNNLLGGGKDRGGFGAFGGGGFVDVNTLQQQLKDQYGIESTVTNVNGQQALKFANGDTFIDTNGNGIMDGMDYNFGGAVDAIKAKYGFSDADLERFSTDAGRLELGGLANSRLAEELKRDDFQNIQDVADPLFGAAFGLAE